jgi:hypothetical protein
VSVRRLVGALAQAWRWLASVDARTSLRPDIRPTLK